MTAVASKGSLYYYAAARLPRHGAVLHAGSEAGESSFTAIVADAPDPPHALALLADGVSASAGLGLGSSQSSVERVLGKGTVKAACGFSAVRYEPREPAVSESEMWFIYRDGKVAAITDYEAVYARRSVRTPARFGYDNGMPTNERYTAKEHRQIEHIKESEEARGMSPEEAEAVGYATVIKLHPERERFTDKERARQAEHIMESERERGVPAYRGVGKTDRLRDRQWCKREVPDGQRSADPAGRYGAQQRARSRGRRVYARRSEARSRPRFETARPNAASAARPTLFARQCRC